MVKVFGTQGDKKRKYTEKDKIEVLAILRDNGYDYMKTSKETGVAYNSLTNWNNKYTDKLGHADVAIAIANKTEFKLSKMKESFLQQHFENLNTLAAKAIKKANKLMDEELDLNKVTNSIKIIGDLYAKLATVEGGVNATGTPQTVNLIQQSITMMNEIHRKDN